MKKLFLILGLMLSSSLMAYDASFKPAIRVYKAELYDNVTFPTTQDGSQGLILGFEIAACRQLNAREFAAEVVNGTIDLYWVNPVDCFGPARVQKINFNLESIGPRLDGQIFVGNPLLIDFSAN